MKRFLFPLIGFLRRQAFGIAILASAGVAFALPDESSLTVPRDLAIAGGYAGRVDGWRTPCRLLTAPFTGVIDDWKFTRKALTAQELDWIPPSGCVIVVR